MKLCHLDRRQRAVEDLDLVDQAVLEPAVAEPLADGEEVVAAAGDLLGELVADDLAIGPPAVNVERQPRGPARPVVGDRDVGPLADRHRLAGPDADRVARPEVDQADAQLAVLDQELIAPAAGVRPGHRAVDDHRAVLVIRRLDPHRQRERLGSVEVAQRERDVVLAAEPQPPADLPFDDLGILRRLARLLRIGPVDDLAALDRLEREVADQAGEDRFAAALRRLEPVLERLVRARRPRPGENGLGLADLRLGRGDGAVAVGRRQEERRRRRGVGEVRVEAELVDAGEEARQLIILFLGDRIIFMAVAAGALEREAQERGREGVRPVGDVLDAELLLDAAPLVGLAVVPVEGRRQDLVAGRGPAAGRRPVAR